MSHRFEEIDSDEEVGTPTTRPTYTYQDDSEIPINRINSSDRRHEESRHRSSERHHRDHFDRRPRSLFDSFFDDDDDFFGGGFFGSRRRRAADRHEEEDTHNSRRRERRHGGTLMRSFFDDDDDDFFGGFRRMHSSMMREFDRMHDNMSSLMHEARSGNGNAQYYTSSRRIVSRNGITEETAQEEDSTGHKRLRVRRQIGDRGSQIERQYSADGTETTTKRLHNLRDEEEPDFEREWQETTGGRGFREMGLGFDNQDRGRRAIRQS